MLSAIDRMKTGQMLTLLESVPEGLSGIQAISDLLTDAGNGKPVDLDRASRLFGRLFEDWRAVLSGSVLECQPLVKVVQTVFEAGTVPRSAAA